MIEIEKAIELLNDCMFDLNCWARKVNINNLPTKEDYTNAYNMAIQALKEKQERDKGGWVKCSDGIPGARHYETGEPIEFIVMLKHGSMPTTAYIGNNDKWYTLQRELDEDEEKIIAWRFLPEPYKEV